MGQSGAINAITKALKISRAGLTDIRKPIGVFLMCGPSGVGKTETALAIADQFFGAEDAIVSINMTEFKEAHKTSMLLGAPAGYVGYGKGGVLTEAIKQRPYCVLLLDEMEKAHPAIHDVFFQIFDKGYINDSEGQRIDFRNTIIIMTSNAGGEKIHELAQQSDSRLADDDLVSYLRPVLLEYFSPAFIGRTELIAYLPLDKASSSTLVDIHLGRIKERLQAQYGVLLVWQTDLLDYIVNANLDPLSGGRALESIVNRQLLPLLAQTCIERLVEGAEMSQIDLAYTANGITVEVT
jgi:type VI secretion system protein VasG